MKRGWMAGALMLAAMPAVAGARDVRVEGQSLEAVQAMMTNRQATSADLVRAYLARIAAMDRKGPALHAVIALNPDALAQAKALDAERRAGHVRGPLHGVPILVKDNIETLDAMATTAGSLALRDNVTRRDAPVVARLRAAGAVILGKTNLSEWANIRSTRAMSGWSAVGGLVRNPYALDRTACGSSSGTGAAVAASYAPAGLGTETDGSVVCPSSINGLVGLKPTKGLVAGERIVPISHSQDTAGPMATDVRDVATLLTAMAEPHDGKAAGEEDYAAGLSASALSGLRIAVLRPENMTPDLKARFEASLDVLRAAGAALVDVQRPKTDGMGEAELLVLQTELKADLDAFLATTPPAVTARTLDQVIAFNRAHAAEEMPYFAQETFEAAAKTRGLDDPAYKAARAKSLRLATDAIDTMLAAAKASVLVEPTYDAAWLTDPVYGDKYDGPSASELPAISGYPNLTVPMGQVRGLPVGLSFVGPKWSEARLLGAGYAFEQRARGRMAPTYRASVPVE